MHPLAFQFKQVHLAVVALGRKIFQDAGLHDMTPARFDLLFAIRSQSRWFSSQRFIREELGLSGATVSRTIKRLRELKLVTSQVGGDERTREIVVTKRGRELFTRAMQLVFRIHHIRHIFNRCTGGDRTRSDKKRSWKDQIFLFEQCLNIVDVVRGICSGQDPLEYIGHRCVMLYRFNDNPFD